MTLLASRLRLGDTIGVFTPSGEIDDSPSESPYEELEKGTRFLEKLGFKVVLGENALKRGYFGAGTPQERADDINQMFANPDIHALISSHGGIHANSILPYLDYDLIRRNPKILMGFSDVSTLHLGIYSKTGLVTFHGNMVIWYFGMEPQEYDRQEFLDRLVTGKIGPVNKHSEWRTVRGEKSAEGKLLGGNDWVMSWLLGTPYFPDMSDSILFIEIPGFAPGSFYNRLTQFKQAGIFEKVKGVLIGFANEKDGYKAEDIFLEVTAEYDFPIVKTDDFGHNCPNTTLPVGVQCRLDPASARLEILEACVK